MTYGIPQHLIPLTPDGQIKVKNHLEFLKMCQTREQYIKQKKLDTVMLPLPSDVLLGRGKTIVEHTGNIRLHAIVEECLPAYNSSKNNLEKNTLASEIVERIKSTPGRFLSKDYGVWVEVDDDISRGKVSRLFRTQRQWAKQRNSQERVRLSSELQGTGTLDEQSASKRVRL
jgi:hypothetical protein